MNDSVLTGLIVFNGAVNLLILSLVAPLWNLKGKICMIREMIESHDRRIQAVEVKT